MFELCGGLHTCSQLVSVFSASVRKLLMLAVFTEDFTSWLRSLGMAQFENVSSGSPEKAVEAFVQVLPALEVDVAVDARPDDAQVAAMMSQLEILFSLMKGVEKLGQAEVATDLGYGLASTEYRLWGSPKKGARLALAPVPMARGG